MTQTPPGELRKGPIHRPNCIQPHGVMIVLRSPSLHVTQVSENVAEMLGIEPDDMLEKPLDDILAPAMVAQIRHVVEQGQLNHHPYWLFIASMGAYHYTFEAVIHQYDGMLILELERFQETEFLDERDSFVILQEGLMLLYGAANLEMLYHITAEYIRRLCGFDRIMMYHFSDDESGSVVGEARSEDVRSFMGLRFPAIDVPKPARALAMKNRVRYIPTLSYTPSPIYPEKNPVTGKPLDMSFAVLRNVHPSHIDFLERMGLTASMALSVVADNKLWGFIACNHSSGIKYLPFSRRSACEMLSLHFSSLLPALQEQEIAEAKKEYLSQVTPILPSVSQSHNIVETLLQVQPSLPELLYASGAAICLDGTCHTVGATPAPEDILPLVAWVAENHPDEIFVTDALSKLYPSGESLKEHASGVLAMPLSLAQHAYVIWFRGEAVRDISWCGDPNMTFEVSKDGKKVLSHKSFDVQTQTMYGSSLPWETYVVAAARDIWVRLLLARTR